MAEDAGGSGGREGREGVSSTDVEGRDTEREGSSFSETGGGAGKALENRERAGDFGVLGMLLLPVPVLPDEGTNEDESSAMAGRCLAGTEYDVDGG
jgi:hypothetical protein